MPGWLTNGMTAAVTITGNETLAVDTNLASGVAPQTESITIGQLAASGAGFSIGNTAASVTPNWLNGNFQYALANNSFTLNNPTNPIPGGVIKLRITQDGTGSRVISYGNQYIFNTGTPTGNSVLSTAAGATDLIEMTYDPGLAKVLCTLFKTFA